MLVEVTKESVNITSQTHKRLRSIFIWILVACGILSVATFALDLPGFTYPIVFFGCILTLAEIFLFETAVPKRTLTFRRSRPILIIRTSRPFKKTTEQINLNRSRLKLTKQNQTQYTLTLEGDHDPINLFSWQSTDNKNPPESHPELNLLLENLPYLAKPVLTGSQIPDNTPTP